MLDLVIGPAGSGKTARIIGEIREAALRGETGMALLVPEQYSHEAERELCRAVGDSLSLHACVLSFTGLARRVDEELGRGGVTPLDKGGRLLCMALALSAVGPRLRLYGGARRSPELQAGLLAALDELKAACVTPEQLETAASAAGGSLGAKLSDLALILGAYDAAVGRERSDPADALTLLLEKLPRSAFGRGARLYLDGFTDFTRQEQEVVRELMGRCAQLTVCLTCDALEGGSEVFELSRRTARALLRAAASRGIPARTDFCPGSTEAPLDFYAENLFTYTEQKRDAGGAVTLLRAPGAAAECEAAAARCIALCRDGGARWRDIAVAVRGFEEYRPALEAAFGYYGVPLFTARRTDILQKSLPAFLSAAYALPAGGWETGDLSAYLRTGLSSLTPDECDVLENYCLLWGCRAAQWRSEKDWRMHPDGYGGTWDDAARERLARINALRRRVSEPLLELERRAKEADTARRQAEALYRFMDRLELSDALARRADGLAALGRAQEAAECERLWELCVSALEQFTDLLGDTEMDAETFPRLFLLTLSQYDVGVIPVSLDRVTAGDMDRMRRRNIRHLIVLGASDERLPAPEPEGGVFTGDERAALGELGLPLDAGDAEIWREYSLIYNCLSLPSDTLTLIAPAYGPDGGEARPSFVLSRAAALFGLPVLPADARAARASAPGPALELAAEAPLRPGDALAQSAAAYFEKTDGARLSRLRGAAAQTRGRLSPESARALYGQELRLSASRVDSFSSCRFAYFLRYGLKARPRQSAEFSPPEFGTFMHFILQHVAADAAGSGGFAALDDDALAALTDKYVDVFVREELNDFADKSPRFVYLFRRLTGSVRRIVADMADELRRSDFAPLDFELDFSAVSGVPALPLEGGGSVRPGGIADRVDGWTHDGRLYLRVVDYKTGRKSFDLSDVWYGMGLQMLLYLFTLERCAPERYGASAVPAGVLYVPARDPLLSAASDLSDEELAARRAQGLARSGLLLDDPQVLFAMEKSDSPLRLPVKWKDGVPSGEALASSERLGLLGRHIEETLRAMARELKAGSIAADPYYKSAQDNACRWCDYADACRLRDGEGGDRRRYLEHLPATRIWNLLKDESERRNGDA